MDEKTTSHCVCYCVSVDGGGMADVTFHSLFCLSIILLSVTFGSFIRLQVRYVSLRHSHSDA